MKRVHLVIAVTMVLIMFVVGPAAVFAGGEQEPSEAAVTILIHQSPWYGAFETITKLYTEQTGIAVNLDVVAFDGVPVKGRAAFRDVESPYDLVTVHPYYAGEFYSAGYITPLKEIDPNFEFDPQIAPLGGPVYWNEKTEALDASGKIMSFPHTPNFMVLYYRADLYDQAGLEPPETWSELINNSKKLANPPELYGMVKRGARGDPIFFDFYGFMYGYGGSIEKDMRNGDFTVTLNSPEVKRALDSFIELATEWGPPEPGAIGSSEVIQYLTTGKVVHAEWASLGWKAMDNPETSSVVGKLNTTVLPRPVDGEHGTSSSLWLMSIPSNLPDARKQAAMDFGKWFLSYDAQYEYFKAGGVPVRQDVMESDLVQTQELRFFKAHADSMKNNYGHLTGKYEEESQVVDIVGLRLNQALTGELSSAEALNLAAEEVYKVFLESGRNTGLLEKLPE